MVTNGYLLTPATASSLESMRVGTVQVTLDGLPHTHNERRPLVDGSPTFETIVNNLRALPAQLYVPLRINVDKRNRSSVINLLRSLEELGITGKSNRIHPYIAPVTAHMEACAHVAPDCMGKREFSEFEIEIIEELLEEGINLVRYPLRMVGTCGASRVMSYVVDPEGLLYKCWNETGTAGWSVGHISSETVELGSRLTRWLQYTPFRRTDCRECTYLPLCNGGCPYLSLWLPEEISDCTHWRYYLEQMLRLYTRLGIVEKQKCPEVLSRRSHEFTGGGLMEWIVKPRVDLGVSPERISGGICFPVLCLSKLFECPCQEDWDAACGWVWSCYFCRDCPPQVLPYGSG